ncbi:hypothetical protein HNY73_013602 [Argiope bruennichi]|uniref:Uncharacterized protein n=1 Tax=Argiope bruennichi TaxID=94029 RepID=A0A8T0EYJ6_ARGBR|nr:hypothetical protein HNY73_013602 [Argiope bruennichi]
MLVKAILKAIDEFEIKQVHKNRNLDEGNSSRSLVFKISKRINKTSKQQDIATDHKITSNNCNLREELKVSGLLNSEISSKSNLEDNISIKHLIETGTHGDAEHPVTRDAPKSAVQDIKNLGPVLRRTSKRIILRVTKPSFEVNDKELAGQKIKVPFCDTAKQGLNYGRMGRRKGGRKTLSEAISPKPEPVRRGRGRPRTVNRDVSVQKTEKIVSVKGSKASMKSLAIINHADSSSVWTLVPKEFVNSDYFKSQVLKMQERTPRGKRPQKILRASHVQKIPQIPFSSRENTKVQFPKIPPVAMKPAVEQHPRNLPSAPSRPTVIYFKAPKNGLDEMEVNAPVLNRINLPDQQQVEAFSPEEHQFSSHLRQNYGYDAALEYIYGVSYQNIKINDLSIRNMISDLKQSNVECNSQFNQQYYLQNRHPVCQNRRQCRTDPTFLAVKLLLMPSEFCTMMNPS